MPNKLQSDSQGFLVGDRLDAEELLTEWQKVNGQLTAIERAVADILGLMKRGGEPERRPNEKREALATNTTRREVPRRERSTPAPVEPRRRSSASRPAAFARPAAEPVEAVKPSRRGAAPDVPPAPAKEGAPRAAVKPQGPREAAPEREKGAREAAPDRAKAPRVASPASPTGRDAKGRFVGKGGDGDAAAARLGEESRLGRFAEKVADAVRDAGDEVGETDPAVQAMTEIAQPISRGFELFNSAFGGSSPEETWLQKIFRSLTGMRKENSLFQKTASKRLKGIEEKPVAVAGDGGASLMSGPLGALKALPTMLMPMLKKIPLIGAALTAAGGLFGILDSELDPRVTRSEKDQKTGRAAGGMAGGLGGLFGGAKAGAALGAFAGPVGAAVGGVVGAAAGAFFGDKAGAIVGDKIGAWVGELRDADIPGSISAAWSLCIDGVKGSWDAATARFSEAWTGVTTEVSTAWTNVTSAISGTFSDLSEQAKSWFSSKVDAVKSAAAGVSEAIRSWTEKTFGENGPLSGVGSAVKGAASWISDRVAAVKQAVTERRDLRAAQAKYAGASVVGGAVKAEQAAALPGMQAAEKWRKNDAWKLGQTSERFESGGRGAGTVSTGRGDFGGASYGTYQLSSRTGTLQRFLDQSGYGKKIQEMASTGKDVRPGDAEFNRAWKELAASDPQFAQAQHDFIKTTHYDAAMKNLQANGIDLSGRGRAVQDALWSTSVQFGAGSAKGGGATGLIQKALAGRDVASMSDEDIINSIQDYKLENNDSLFKRSSTAVRAGTRARASRERDALLSLAREDREAVPQSQKDADMLLAARAQIAQNEGIYLSDEDEGANRILTDAAIKYGPERAAGMAAKSLRGPRGSLNSPGSKEFRAVMALEDAKEQRKLTLSERVALNSRMSKVNAARAKEAEQKEQNKFGGLLRNPAAGAPGAAVKPAAVAAAPAVTNAPAVKPAEGTSYVGLLRNPAAKSPVVAAAPAVSLPQAVPAVPQAAPAAPVAAPMGRPERKPVVAVKVEGETPQDVKDRNIAHIVTGGLSA